MPTSTLRATPGSTLIVSGFFTLNRRAPAILCRTGRGLTALAIFLLCFSSPSLWANESPVKSVRAIRVSQATPKIDGVLDDEVWQHAPVASGFYQRDPEEGIPASEETAFQIVYDDEALYIAILCYDSEPDKIVHAALPSGPDPLR